MAFCLTRGRCLVNKNSTIVLLFNTVRTRIVRYLYQLDVRRSLNFRGCVSRLAAAQKLVTELSVCVAPLITVSESRRPHTMQHGTGYFCYLTR